MHKLPLSLLAICTAMSISCGKKFKNTTESRVPAAVSEELVTLKTSTNEIGLITFNNAAEATVPAELRLRNGTFTDEKVRIYFSFSSMDDFAYQCEYLYNSNEQLFLFHKCYEDLASTTQYSSYPGYPEFIYPSKSLALEIITNSENTIEVEAKVELNNL